MEQLRSRWKGVPLIRKGVPLIRKGARKGTPLQ
jgi:hypothetical protein